MARLKGAYRHPWLGEREQVFEYYDERVLEGSPYSRVSDLNVRDSANFSQLRNLQKREIESAMRKSLRFFDSQ